MKKEQTVILKQWLGKPRGRPFPDPVQFSSFQPVSNMNRNLLKICSSVSFLLQLVCFMIASSRAFRGVWNLLRAVKHYYRVGRGKEPARGKGGQVCWFIITLSAAGPTSKTSISSSSWGACVRPGRGKPGNNEKL